MSTNINNTGQKICLFCYCCTYRFQQIENDITLNQIVTTCNKHLPQECIVNINWETTYAANKSFCHECCNITQQILTLNSDLERILKDIEGISSNFANRILSGRRNFELANTNYRNLNESVKDNNVDNTFNISFSYSPITTTSITNFGNFTSQASENTYDADSATPDESTNNKSSEDCITTVPTEHNLCENEPSQTNINSNKKPGNLKRSLERNNKDPTAGSAERIPTITTGSDLQRHIDNDIASGFLCEKCHKRFSRLTILQKHDCSKPTFECEVCKKSFSGTGVLKLHMRCHTGEKPFKCDICGKSFSVRCHLTTHLKVHSEEKPFMCSICQKSFKDDNYLKKHIKMHKKGESKFKCDICSKSFATFTSLRLHIMHHKGETPHRCETCGKAYTSDVSLRVHKRRSHLQVKPFKCEQCGKGFSENCMLVKHMQTHSTVKGFLCEECGKSFATSQYLAIHTLIHTEKGPFVCEICGKKYPSSVRLKSHLRVYHSEMCIKCENCNIVFKSHPELVRHQESLDCQSGPPFLCNQCDKSFSYKISRQRHIAQEHLSENERENFQCDLCQTSFLVRADLQLHKRRNLCQLVKTSNVNGSFFCETCENYYEDQAKFESHHYKRRKRRRCQYCPTRLDSWCQYNVHRQKSHPSVESSYQCKICNFSSGNMYNLRIHMKLVHPNESINEEDIDSYYQESIPSSSSVRTRSMRETNMESESVSSSEGEDEDEIGNSNDVDGENIGNEDDQMEIKVEDVGFEVKNENDDYILGT